MNAPEAARAAERAERLRRWEAWLALQPEAAIEPELPIVDAHHHLWDRGGHRYLAEEFAREFAREFAPDGGGHRVVASVYVECLSRYDEGAAPALRPVGETAYVASLAGRERGVAAAIVGAVDLALGAEVAAVLDAHERAGDGAFRGVRYVTAWDASPEVHGSYVTREGMLAAPAVRVGAAELARRGYPLDLWLYFHQLGEAVALAQALPELQIVIDHCGGPIGVGPHAHDRESVLRTWRGHVAALARCPNVTLKLGGLAMPVAGHGWRTRAVPPHSDDLVAAWRPVVEECVAAFGADRCMFESNFPVDRTGCTYASLWNAFKKLSAGGSAAERAALFAGTARRVYRL